VGDRAGKGCARLVLLICTTFKGKYDAKLEFPERVWGSNLKKNLLWVFFFGFSGTTHSEYFRIHAYYMSISMQTYDVPTYSIQWHRGTRYLHEWLKGLLVNPDI